MAGAIAAVGAANTVSKIGASPANNIISSAKSQMISKHGVKSFFLPQYWYLSLLKLSLSQPILIGCVCLIAAVVLGAWFFGEISIYYGLFFLKSCICVVVNLFLTLGNAIYFGFHAITQVMQLAFFDLINNIFNLILAPVVNAINQLAVWTTLAESGTNFIDLAALGEGANISAQPTHGFAYLLPTSVIGAKAWGFLFVHPGENIYAVDVDNNVIYDEVFDQTGAKLLFPMLNPDARSDGWWTAIRDRPPDQDYHFAYNLQVYTETFIETIRNWVTGWIDGALDAVWDSIDNISSGPINPLWPPIQIPWLYEIFGGLYG